jgi:hypothetical protein
LRERARRAQRPLVAAGGLAGRALRREQREEAGQRAGLDNGHAEPRIEREALDGEDGVDFGGVGAEQQQ